MQKPNQALSRPCMRYKTRGSLQNKNQIPYQRFNKTTCRMFFSLAECFFLLPNVFFGGSDRPNSLPAREKNPQILSFETSDLEVCWENPQVFFKSSDFLVEDLKKTRGFEDFFSVRGGCNLCKLHGCRVVQLHQN